MERVLITVLVAGVIVLAWQAAVPFSLLLALTGFAAFIFIGDLATLEYRQSKFVGYSSKAAAFDWTFLIVEGVIFTALLLILLLSYQ